MEQALTFKAGEGDQVGVGQFAYTQVFLVLVVYKLMVALDLDRAPIFLGAQGEQGLLLPRLFIPDPFKGKLVYDE